MKSDRTRATRVPPLAGPEWRDFLRWPLYAVLAASLLMMAVAYQRMSGASATIDVGARGDQAYLSGFYAPEQSSDKANPFNYRWTRSFSTIRLPGVGRNVPLDVTFFMAGRPQGAPTPNVRVESDGRQVATLQPQGYPPNPYTVHVPAEANTADDLTLVLGTDQWSPEGESRPLGVVLERVQVKQAARGLVVPPIYPLGWLLLCLLLAHMALRHIGLGLRASHSATLALGALVATGLATTRYDLTIFVEEAAAVMTCVYVMALLLPPLVAWSMHRMRVDMSVGELRALILIFLTAFAVKAGGMMHPQFVDLDHIFRVHQVQELVNNPARFWDKYQHVTTADERGTVHNDEQHSMLGQWNMIVPFPYSPAGYYLLAPLGWIWPGGHEYELVTASDTFLAALSGTVIFALFALVKRGLRSGRAGVLAGAIVSFAPITYLHFSDGAYPYIWAGWISVVYLMAAVLLAPVAGKPWPFALLSVMSALTILSHTAIAFFALAFIAAVAVIALVLRRVRPGVLVGVRLAPLLLSFLVGCVLSLVYYGGYIVPVLTVSIPALLQRGSSSGVGQDESQLGFTLLSGFFPQIEAHFAVWPALLALVGIALAGWAMLRHKPSEAPSEGSDAVRSVAVIFLAAWAVVFLAFSAIDLRVNLLQRHMLFGLPLLAVLAGYALARLERSVSPGKGLRKAGWAAPVLSWLLVGYLFFVGLVLWVGRSLFYVLPPGSG